MSSIKHERPGVYSSYDASSIVRGGGNGRTVGIAAKSAGGTAGELYWLTGQEEAAAFGAEDSLTELVGLLFLNGAGLVCAVPVRGDADYAGAFQLLEGQEEISVMLCDSTVLSIQQAARDGVQAASGARRERVAVLPSGAGTASQLAVQAGAINSERVVLVAPGSPQSAAAVAGAIAAERDPAVPLGGAVLTGLGTLEAQYGDNELDVLIRGGVTPLERVGGQVSVVRGVTTRTQTGGVSDATWRELTTIRIIDEVIPAIRGALRAKFSRAKNTVQSRGAVRAQVILELEERVSREIIGSYENVVVSASSEEPTVCLVDFSFSVVHGMNQIWMTAHIKV